MSLRGVPFNPARQRETAGLSIERLSEMVGIEPSRLVQAERHTRRSNLTGSEKFRVSMLLTKIITQQDRLRLPHKMNDGSKTKTITLEIVRQDKVAKDASTGRRHRSGTGFHGRRRATG
jgi:hypothetical protein